MEDGGKYSLVAENKNGTDHVDLDLETGASSLALTSTTTALTTGRSVLLVQIS